MGGGLPAAVRRERLSGAENGPRARGRMCLWLAVGVVPLAALAWWMSRAGRFSRQESVALLDESLGAGGLLMTLTEVPAAEWEARLPQVEQRWRQSMPRFRYERFANFVLPPLAFAVAVCFVPLKEIEAARVVKNTAAQQATAQLEEPARIARRDPGARREREGNAGRGDRQVAGRNRAIAADSREVGNGRRTRTTHAAAAGRSQHGRCDGGCRQPPC